MNLTPDSKNSEKALGANDKTIFCTGDQNGWQTITTDTPFVKAANQRLRGRPLDVKVSDSARFAGR
jgi:hypothetical protein